MFRNVKVRFRSTLFIISFCGCILSTTVNLLASQQQKASYQKSQKPIHRIISLSPATTQILFDLGLGHLIVGTTRYSDDPIEAKKIQRIGDYQRPNLEMVLALKPTIVIAVKEGVDTISSTLHKAKIPLIVLNTQSLLDFEQNIKILAKAFSVRKRGNEIIQEWQNNWNKIPTANKNMKVIIQVDQNPLILAGQQTHLDQLIQKCGGTNVFKQKGYQKVSREVIAHLKPDKILNFANDTDNQDQVIRYWKSYPFFQDFQEVQFFSLDQISQVSRLTLRLSQMASQICSQIMQNRPKNSL